MSLKEVDSKIYNLYLMLIHMIEYLKRLDIRDFRSKFKRNNLLLELPLRRQSDFERLHTGNLGRAIKTNSIDLVELNKMTLEEAKEYLCSKYRSSTYLSYVVRLKHLFNAISRPLNAERIGDA